MRRRTRAGPGRVRTPRRDGGTDDSTFRVISQPTAKGHQTKAEEESLAMPKRRKKNKRNGFPPLVPLRWAPGSIGTCTASSAASRSRSVLPSPGGRCGDGAGGARSSGERPIARRATAPTCGRRAPSRGCNRTENGRRAAERRRGRRKAAGEGSAKPPDPAARRHPRRRPGRGRRVAFAKPPSRREQHE